MEDEKIVEAVEETEAIVGDTIGEADPIPEEEEVVEEPEVVEEVTEE